MGVLPSLRKTRNYILLLDGVDIWQRVIKIIFMRNTPAKVIRLRATL